MAQRTARVTVRFAKTEADARNVVELGRESFQLTRMSGHPFDEERALALARKGMAGGSAVLLVARRGTEDVGFAAGQIGAALFSAARTATVVAFYVRPSVLNGEAALKLIQAFRNWAEAAKADEIQLHVTSGVKMAETDRFMRRIGFRQTGGNYVQELS
jgi:hypothetical protein